MWYIFSNHFAAVSQVMTHVWASWTLVFLNNVFMNIDSNLTLHNIMVQALMRDSG